MVVFRKMFWYLVNDYINVVEVILIDKIYKVFGIVKVGSGGVIISYLIILGVIKGMFGDW